MMQRLQRQSIFIALTLVVLLALSACGGSKPNPELNLGGIDIGEVFSGMMASIPNAINGISSMESVDKAKEELTGVSLDLDDLIFNSEKLSEAGRLDLAMMALNATADVESLAQMVDESPVFKEKLGGTMDDIIKKLKQLI